MAVIHGNDNNFEELIKEGIVIVDMFATWCGPCKMLGPVVEELSNEYTNIKFVKIDVDECADVAKKYGIMSIPTLIKFENGQEIDKKIGFINKEQFKEWLK